MYLLLLLMIYLISLNVFSVRLNASHTLCNAHYESAANFLKATGPAYNPGEISASIFLKIELKRLSWHNRAHESKFD